MVAIMAHSGGPMKTGGLQGKVDGVRGPRPLGAGMDSSAFHGENKYCHNGGMASAPSSRTRRDYRRLRGP
jgi:hypothetical protein